MSTTPNGTPATKADLENLKNELLAHFDQHTRALEEKLVETMRDMQPELLRGFAAHNSGLTVRMRKLEADQNNLDSSVSPRLAALEEQVTQMNVRLMKLEVR